MSTRPTSLCLFECHTLRPILRSTPNASVAFSETIDTRLHVAHQHWTVSKLGHRSQELLPSIHQSLGAFAKFGASTTYATLGIPRFQLHFIQLISFKHLSFGCCSLRKLGQQKLNEFNGAEEKAGNKWFHMIQRDVNHPEISIMNRPMIGYINYESFQKYEAIPRISVDSIP